MGACRSYLYSLYSINGIIVLNNNHFRNLKSFNVLLNRRYYFNNISNKKKIIIMVHRKNCHVYYYYKYVNVCNMFHEHNI